MQSSTVRFERVVFLDWLRVIAIGVLLFFHTGMLFVGWGWHIVDAQTVPALEFPMDIAHRLRMPLLFVIAGAGVHFALGRRGVGEVLRERALRLLLPLMVGVLVIVPPQAYVEQVFRRQWQGGYLEFYAERVMNPAAWPGALMVWHHLWFIAYLWVYCVLFVPVFAAWRRHRAGTLRPGVWIYLLALPLGVNEALLRPMFPETHNLVSDWWIFNHYALLFIYGIALCGVQGIWDWLMGLRQVNLLLGGGVIFGILGGEARGWEFFQDDTIGDGLSANLFTWLWLLVFLGYGRRWLSFSNAALRYLGEAGYPIYILHQTVIVVVAWFVVRQTWAWQVKYGVVLGATVLISFAVYEGVIRRWGLARVLFGLKAGDAK